jgi:hypothetical protein
VISTTFFLYNLILSNSQHPWKTWSKDSPWKMTNIVYSVFLLLFFFWVYINSVFYFSCFSGQYCSLYINSVFYFSYFLGQYCSLIVISFGFFYFHSFCLILFKIWWKIVRFANFSGCWIYFCIPKCNLNYRKLWFLNDLYYQIPSKKTKHKTIRQIQY